LAGIVYVGVFLSPDQQWRLFDKIFPCHENVFGDHLTIKFRPTAEEVAQLPLGKQVLLEVIGVAWDEKGQAALIRGVQSNNKHPHITISTARGVKPVYSNELFEKVFTMLFDEPLILSGVVDTFPPQQQGEKSNG